MKANETMESDVKARLAAFESTVRSHFSHLKKEIELLHIEVARAKQDLRMLTGRADSRISRIEERVCKILFASLAYSEVDTPGVTTEQDTKHGDEERR